VARFLREARTAAALKSEHVARVSDVGTHDTGLPYMVMERLCGSDLAHVLAARETIPAAEAVGYVVQACEAITEAHALGIVHRDLKPSNLFLTRRPNGAPLVKILDFGISKIDASALAAHGKEKLTATGALMGSPLYMSPEQARGSRSVDTRTDIWSLGVVLHELVSGRHPFEAESVTGILAAIAADPPTPLRRHQPDAPLELEAVVLRCLEKNLARRTPDIATLVGELRPLSGVEGPPEPHPRLAEARPDDAAPWGRTTERDGATSGPLSGRTTERDPVTTGPLADRPSIPVLSTGGSDPLGTAAPAWASATNGRRARRWTAFGAVAAALVVGGAVVIARSGLLGNGPVAPTLAASTDAPAPAPRPPAQLVSMGDTPKPAATSAGAEPVASVATPAQPTARPSSLPPEAPRRSTSPRLASPAVESRTAQVEAPPPPKPIDPLSDR
jgi:serine/threonine-protein kinase